MIEESLPPVPVFYGCANKGGGRIFFLKSPLDLWHDSFSRESQEMMSQLTRIPGGPWRDITSGVLPDIKPHWLPVP